MERIKPIHKKNKTPEHSREKFALYDPEKSFLQNLVQAHSTKISVPQISLPKQEVWTPFLGYTLSAPLGVPACPVMLSDGISLLSKLGYSFLTYKTIRSTPKAPHPLPNVVYLELEKQLDYDSIGKKITVCERNPHDPSDIAIANSFGNASFDRQFLLQDIAKAKKALTAGQILNVSVFGESVFEFVAATHIALEAGADTIEINLSCPNVESEHQSLYTNTQLVEKVCRAVVHETEHKIPVLIKVGYFHSHELMQEILCTAARTGIRGVCGLNTVPMKIITKDGRAGFDRQRLTAGVSGNPIRTLALDFVKNAQEINREHALGLQVLGTGGITKPEHFKQFLDNGASLALSATGTMWNPYLAYEYLEAFQRADKCLP